MPANTIRDIRFVRVEALSRIAPKPDGADFMYLAILEEDGEPFHLEVYQDRQMPLFGVDRPEGWGIFIRLAGHDLFITLPSHVDYLRRQPRCRRAA